MNAHLARLDAKLREAKELCHAGRWHEAYAVCEEILSVEPRNFHALHLEGVIAARAGTPDVAVVLLDKAISIDPSNAAAYVSRGNVLDELHRWDDALASYDQAVSVEPTLARAYFCRGNVLQKLKRWNAAVASYDDAIRLDSEFAESYSNRGIALTAIGRLTDALASFDKALAVKQDYAEAHVGRGNVFKELNQLDDALASYNRAIVLRRDYADAFFCRAISMLLSGNLAQGWIDFEWRFKTANGFPHAQHREFREPLWLGRDSVAGKTVLLYSERGLGDTLQFCRYAKPLADLQARVILQVQRPLVAVLANLDGAAIVVAEGDPLPQFDVRCPLLSLPLAFKTELRTIPGPQKYLRADAGRVARWRALLGRRNKAAIGLVWRGDPNNMDDRNRSIPLMELLRHLPVDLEYFSLQKEAKEEETPLSQSSPPIARLADELDFGETAAICESLDLVVSVDTSVAHLSGALGTRTWILLPFSPDCRWLLDREDSPWYPSVKLYRQDNIGDWSGVLARVGADLTREFAGARDNAARRSQWQADKS